MNHSVRIEDALATVRRERDALKYDVENMTAKFDQMKEERDALKAVLEGIRAEAQRQADNLPHGGYRQGLVFLASLAGQYHARIDALEAGIDALEAENASLADRHNRESHGTASHEAMAYDELRAERDTLRADLDHLRGWRDAWKKDALRYLAERDSLKAENERLRAWYPDEEFQALLLECDALKAENTQLFAAWHNALKERDTLKADLELSRQSLANTGKAYEEAMDEVERLREQNDGWHEQRLEWDKERDALKAEVGHLRAQVRLENTAYLRTAEGYYALRAALEKIANMHDYPNAERTSLIAIAREALAKLEEKCT